MFDHIHISSAAIRFSSLFPPSKQARNQGWDGMFLELNFTGKETDCETGYSYFGARYYDPTLLTSWTAVDPMADKYPSLSPYNYCAWNPIKLTDPSGDSVVFMDDNVKKMFNEVYNNVCVRMAELKSKGFKRDRHKEEYASLSNIKQSMDDVINSETNFYYYSLPNPDGAIISGGHTYGKDGINGVVLEITDMCYGTLVHETKHASQYLSGDWEFDRNNVGDDGKFRYINYDFQDEFDAYRQGFDYMFYFDNEQYRDDDYIKRRVNDYKVNSSSTGIIPEYIQYNKANPYKKN